MARHQITSSATCTAAHVPTNTGAAETGSVRGRAPATHLFIVRRSWAMWEPVELGTALLEVRLLALLRFLGHVVEERGVTGELLDAGETVVGRVARRLDH